MPPGTTDKLKHSAQEWVWTDASFLEGSTWLHTLLLIAVFDHVKAITNKKPPKTNQPTETTNEKPH